MRIGQITLYNYNYGSSLQCFSTQEYLKEYNCECFLVEIERSGRIGRFFSTINSLLLKCINNPFSIKQVMSQFNAQRFRSMKITDVSLAEINRFILNNINRKAYKYRELKEKACTNEYDFFFTGSDQVWNGARIIGLNYYFLRFAPLNKRVAFAASFGGKDIAPYNRRIYAKYISEFKELSVREKSGKEIIEQLTREKSDIICDPVILFTGDQWRKKYDCRSSFHVDGRYLCLFFIDTISECALKYADNLSKKRNLRVLSFGYNYSSYSTLMNHVHYDGSPFDFLKCIDNAEIVITDSFHATVFSLLLHTEFYAFTRSYEHGQNQSARLQDLLENLALADRFDPTDEKQRIDFSGVDCFFIGEREKADIFLTRVLNKGKESSNNTITLFEHNADCCGCGACADACPKKAISIVPSNEGGFPVIDHEKCVKCENCLNACGLKNLTTNHAKKTSYIGRSIYEDIANRSASGGAFATMAFDFLKNGGVVYGASFSVEEGKCDCKHIRIDNADELSLILNSKYVQSRTDGIFRRVRDDLKQGKKVLFSGTSCQVSSLKAFVGDETENLYTIDLICHGVPSIELLQEYVDYIQNKEKSEVVGISFRCKDRSISEFAPYVMTFDLKKGKEVLKKHISLRDSSFYRLFMSMVGYRASCYNCTFASLNKPSDVTLGDYYVGHSKSSFIKALNLDQSDYYSCIICNSEKGMRLISTSNIYLHEIPVEEVVYDHDHLKKASLPTKDGNRLYKVYKKGGFDGLQLYIDRRNMAGNIAKKLCNK